MGSSRRSRRLPSAFVLASTIAFVATGVLVPPAASGADPAWSITPTPNPAGASGAMLNSVACTSAASCFAVGSYQAPKIHMRQVIERWNGSTWSLVPNPAGSAGSVLFDVTCPSVGTCYAVGSRNYKRTLAEHWNGKTWSLMTTPTTQSSLLQGVSCPSKVSCFAVGNALIEHWNGSRWSVVTTAKPIDGDLVDVACPGSASCYAVGTRGTSRGRTLSLVARWDGHGWSAVSLPTTGGQLDGLQDISCVTKMSCVAVGSSVDTRGSADTAFPLIYRWGGAHWSRMTPAPEAPNRDTLLEGIACPSVTRCVAAGSTGPALPYGSQTPKTMVQQWDGSSWSRVATPNPSGATWSELSGVACPSETTCVAVGESDTSHTLAERSA